MLHPTLHEFFYLGPFVFRDATTIVFLLQVIKALPEITIIVPIFEYRIIKLVIAIDVGEIL